MIWIGIVLLLIANVLLKAGSSHVERVLSRAKPHPRVNSDFHSVLSAAAMFQEDHGRWPHSVAELHSPPPLDDGSTAKYLDGPRIDPWSGEPYHLIVHPDGTWDLMSYGADQAPGGEDWDQDLRSDLIPR